MDTDRYSCNWIIREGERIFQLRDREQDSIVEIFVSFGANVIRCMLRGEEMILQPPSLTELRAFPFRYGIPVLSPPGRTSRGKYVYEGKKYKLPITTGAHNTHGMLGTAPWAVDHWEASLDNGAVLHLRYAYSDDLERFAFFPHAMNIRFTYRLKDGRLSLEGTAGNDGNYEAPFALGFHPYFHIHRARSKIMLQIPRSTQWPMDRDGMFYRLPAETELTERLRQGIALNELHGNFHFFQMEAPAEAPSEGGIPYKCTLLDKVSGKRIVFQIDSLFTKLALFVPSWSDAIALEPHSCVPDAFNLSLDPALTGVRALAPGEKIRFGWSIATAIMRESE